MENKEEKDKPKKKRISKKEKEKKEEVCEVFKIEKEDEKSEKSKIVTTCGDEEKKPATKEQINSMNKQLKYMLIIIGIFVLICLIVFYISTAKQGFKYRDVKFDLQKHGKILFYHTSMPLYSEYNKYLADLNIYLRKDPRKLEHIPFEGNGSVEWKDMLVLNSTDSFNCNGDGIIAVANLQQVLEPLGTTVVKDPNASCDTGVRYMFINMQPGNITSIEKVGPSCYIFNVNNCEILDITERFMFEGIRRIYLQTKLFEEISKEKNSSSSNPYSFPNINN